MRRRSRAACFARGAGALPFLVPLTLQVGFGASASKSGAITLASALGSLVMRPMTHAALHRASMRTVLIAGSVSFAAVLVACATLSAAWPDAAIFALLLVGGLSRSLSFASMGALVFSDVPSERLAAATSFQGTAQQLMRAVGVAVAASALHLAMLAGGRGRASQADFACAFVAIALVVLASVPMFAALPAARAKGSRGRRAGRGSDAASKSARKSAAGVRRGEARTCRGRPGGAHGSAGRSIGQRAMSRPAIGPLVPGLPVS